MPDCMAAVVLSGNYVGVVCCNVARALVVAMERRLIAEATSWASESGTFKANLDPALLRPRGTGGHSEKDLCIFMFGCMMKPINVALDEVKPDVAWWGGAGIVGLDFLREILVNRILDGPMQSCAVTNAVS